MKLKNKDSTYYKR